MPLEGDIYRGEVLPAPVPTAESVVAASTTSSSGTFITGRLGALAALVEHAITRWARSRRQGSSASSQSSGSTSLRSSIYTPSRPRLSRWRQRRTSSANSRSIHSEREVAARLRVRHKIRRVDRGFTLYIPPNLNPEISVTQLLESFDTPQSISRTTSLPIVLNRLEATLKKASRLNKVKTKGKQRQHSLGVPPLSLHHNFMSHTMSTRAASFGDLSALRSSRKQKEHSKGTRTPNDTIPGGSRELNRAPKAWWLDVVSPTWDDLQTIGKVRSKCKLVVLC
jgi:magnesium transporter